MGCASLSLLMRMIRSGQFNDKKILLIDKEPKTKNDRTWCFWERENGFFDPIVYKKWPIISFHSEEYSSSMDISPYQYKMVRGIDFYEYCFKEIAKQSNIELLYANVDKWYIHHNEVIFVLDGKENNFGNAEVFNSIYEPAVNDKKIIRLLQHFKGWLIETKDPCFDPGKAIMMDFRVHQEKGTTFAYVLPFSEKKALVEYTLFSKELLQKDIYDIELKNYIENILGIKAYQITEKEFGVIPMTNEKLKFNAHGWQIGTAGGQTKASSGYTFQFIQKQSDQILKKLISKQSLNSIKPAAARFRFYDNTLLHILYHDQLPGKKIFTLLFKKNEPQQVLRFLDNESSFMEELKIISSLPTWPFMKAALQH